MISKSSITRILEVLTNLHLPIFIAISCDCIMKACFSWILLYGLFLASYRADTDTSPLLYSI